MMISGRSAPISKTHAAMAAAAGFILADTEWNPVYANAEARKIMAYPEDPSGFRSGWTTLRKRMVPLPCKQNSFSSSSSRAEFISGRRRYTCLAIPLARSQDPQPNGASVAVVLERGAQHLHIFAEMSEGFRLTEREHEVVEFLIQGLTNKEIAVRMNISPNTVRAFVRMVMGKLGVSTRSGIVGVVFRVILTHPPWQEGTSEPHRRN
jgi:DNA-binding CsgD family transcriptional regulator